MSRIDIFSIDWSSLPLDLITSIVPYLSPSDILKLCLRNDSFNRRVCQDQNSIIWKLLYQRDISSHIPRHNIASRYLDVMDYFLPLRLNDRLIYSAQSGYNAMVKHALKDGANIHAWDDRALRNAALNGYTDTVKLLLDRGANIHANDDEALLIAAQYRHPETVKLLLACGATITPTIRSIVNQSAIPDPEIRSLLKLT